uniref:Ig-like domain-containing protein n=1 Tax=Taeniopygia guttata TaxID=59729 RepID=H1A5A1_TAEGU
MAGRSPTSAWNVGRVSAAIPPVWNTRTSTLGRGPTSVGSVGRASVGTATSPSTTGSTLGNGPMGAWNVRRVSGGIQRSSLTSTSTPGVEHLWVSRVQEGLGCHFANGTEKVRCLRRFTYNREQYAMFDSDVGHFLGFTPYGETAARYCNNDPHVMEQRRTAVDWFCRYNYEYLSPFLTERRCERGAERVPSGPALPGPGRLLCSLVDFYPAHARLRWFQGQQELSVAATDVVPSGDWTHQLLVLLETPTRGELTSTCQVEHVSLEHPLSRNWGRGKEFGVLGEGRLEGGCGILRGTGGALVGAGEVRKG